MFQILQVATAGSGGVSILGAVAGAIPVVGGIISSLINNSNQDQINQENIQFQQQQQEQAEAYNTSMWNAQNAYNSPEEVMQRYTDAGLNPNLIYGGGAGTGNLAELPQPAVRSNYVAVAHPSVDGAAIAAEAVNAYNNTASTAVKDNNLTQLSINTAQDTALKFAQELNVDAQRDLTTAQVTGQNIANLYSGDAMKADIQQRLSASSLALTQQQTDVVMRQPNFLLAVQQLANMKENNNLTAAQIANINANTSNEQVVQKLNQFNLYLQQHGLNQDSSFMSRVASVVVQQLSGASMVQKQSSADIDTGDYSTNPNF